MKQPKFIQRLRYKSARKKLIPHINTSNPIIDDLVDLVIKYRYDYDTIYAVYEEWNQNIEATESTLISALFMCMDPLDITQESVERFGVVLRARMITIGDD